ncbi:uncharacterized protein LOC110842245 [Folsomia candida]|nr:uncharacterized protein LOC110842245 [Folsomia candida]
MNDGSGILAMIKEDMHQLSDQTDKGKSNDGHNFVHIFPPELSNKLFSYLSDRDLFTCSRCCISWRQVINDNSQWKARCISRGWATINSGGNVHQRWNCIKSHVSIHDNYKFRTSPQFVLPEVASLRISPMCDWALYFRQCLHIKRSWDKGIYAIHRLENLKCPDYEYTTLNNDFDCNGKLLVCGTSSGKVLVWSVEGVPTFLESIAVARRRVEVECVLLRSNFLIVLYQNGLIKVFDTGKLSKTINEDDQPKLESVYAIRATGSESPDGFEFVLNAQTITEDDDYLTSFEDDDNDLELWIRELFRIDLWMGNDVEGSNMMIHANENIVVLTGILCKSLFLWKIGKGDFVRHILLPAGSQVVYQSHLSARYLYLSTKRRNVYGNGNPSWFVTVYDLSSLENSDENSPEINPLIIIPSTNMVEEIRSDSKDARIVFSTQDGGLCCVRFENNGFESLFDKQAPSFVDNLTVSDDLIVYHQYDGYLMGNNWAGEELFEISAHIGLVKGLQIFENYLISGGDAMQLCVWDAKTGERCHTVYHQPCRIQHLYADATKIITVGREDPPVLVAYW